MPDRGPSRRTILRRRAIALAGAAVLLVVGVVAALAAGSDDPQPRSSEPRQAAASPTASPAPTEAPEGTATPSATPTAAPSERRSTAELAGRRIVASFRDTTTIPASLLQRAKRGHLAGVVLFAENADTLAEAKRLADRLQAASPHELLIMVDQEGGLVKRITDAPPSQAADEMDDPLGTGKATGRALARGGFTVDLAPVADRPRPGSAIETERRGFSSATKAAAFARGLRQGGVHATAKHYPGFGSAKVNTDNAPATIRTLTSADRAAFRKVDQAGANLVMLAHALFPQLDASRPASFSKRIATTALRKEDGFRGVSITDDLQAQALVQYGGIGTRAVRAARAGVDLLLVGGAASETEAVAKALERDLKRGKLPRSGFEQAIARTEALGRP